MPSPEARSVTRKRDAIQTDLALARRRRDDLEAAHSVATAPQHSTRTSVADHAMAAAAVRGAANAERYAVARVSVEALRKRAHISHVVLSNNATLHEVGAASLDARRREDLADMSKLDSALQRAATSTSHITEPLPDTVARAKLEQLFSVDKLRVLKARFEEADADGTGGLTEDQFVDAFSALLAGDLVPSSRAARDAVRLLFHKIDANFDGTVDFDEFLSYMYADLETSASNLKSAAGSKPKTFAQRSISTPSPHREAIIGVFALPKARLLTVSKDGVFAVWPTTFLRVLATHVHSSATTAFGSAASTQETGGIFGSLAFASDRAPGATDDANRLFGPTSRTSSAWVTDVTFLPLLQLLFVATDNFKLSVYHVKDNMVFERLVVIEGGSAFSAAAPTPLMANVPLCIDVQACPQSNTAVLVLGDTSGTVTVLEFSTREAVSLGFAALLDPEAVAAGTVSTALYTHALLPYFHHPTDAPVMTQPSARARPDLPPSAAAATAAALPVEPTPHGAPLLPVTLPLPTGRVDETQLLPRVAAAQKAISRWIGKVMVLPDMTSFAACSTNSYAALFVRHFDTKAGAQFEKVWAIPGGVADFDYCPAASGWHFLATGGIDRAVRLWKPTFASSEPLARLTGHSHPITKVVLSPPTQEVLALATDNTLRVWDLESYSLLHIIEPFAPLAPNELIASLFRDPDGDYLLATTTDIIPWRVVLASGPETSETLLRGRNVAALYEPFFNVVINVTSTGFVRVWDISSGNLKNTFSVIERKTSNALTSLPGSLAASELPQHSSEQVQAGELELAVPSILPPFAGDGIDPHERRLANVLKATRADQSSATSSSSARGAKAAKAAKASRARDELKSKLARQFVAALAEEDVTAASLAGRKLVVGTSQGALSVWNFNNGQRLWDLDDTLTEPVMAITAAVQLSGDHRKAAGALIASATASKTRVLDHQTRLDLYSQLHATLASAASECSRTILATGWSRVLSMFKDSNASGDDRKCMLNHPSGASAVSAPRSSPPPRAAASPRKRRARATPAPPIASGVASARRYPYTPPFTKIRADLAAGTSFFDSAHTNIDPFEETPQSYASVVEGVLSPHKAASRRSFEPGGEGAVSADNSAARARARRKKRRARRRRRAQAKLQTSAGSVPGLSLSRTSIADLWLSLGSVQPASAEPSPTPRTHYAGDVAELTASTTRPIVAVHISEVPDTESSSSEAESPGTSVDLLANAIVNELGEMPAALAGRQLRRQFSLLADANVDNLVLGPAKLLQPEPTSPEVTDWRSSSTAVLGNNPRVRNVRGTRADGSTLTELASLVKVAAHAGCESSSDSEASGYTSSDSDAVSSSSKLSRTNSDRSRSPLLSEAAATNASITSLLSTASVSNLRTACGRRDRTAASLQRHDEDVLSIAFAAPNIVATGSYNGKIFVWTMGSRSPKAILHAEEHKEAWATGGFSGECAIRVLAFAPYLAQLASHELPPLLAGCGDGSLRMWDVRTGFERDTLHLASAEAGGGPITALTLDPLNYFAFTGHASGRVMIVSLQHGRGRLVSEEEGIVVSHTMPIVALSYVWGGAAHGAQDSLVVCTPGSVSLYKLYLGRDSSHATTLRGVELTHIVAASLVGHFTEVTAPPVWSMAAYSGPMALRRSVLASSSSRATALAALREHANQAMLVSKFRNKVKARLAAQRLPTTDPYLGSESDSQLVVPSLLSSQESRDKNPYHAPSIPSALPAVPPTDHFFREAKFPNVSEKRVFVHFPTASDTPLTCPPFRALASDPSFARRMRKIYGVSWTAKASYKRLKRALPRIVLKAAAHLDDPATLETMTKVPAEVANRSYGGGAAADERLATGEVPEHGVETAAGADGAEQVDDDDVPAAGAPAIGVPEAEMTSRRRGSVMADIAVRHGAARYGAVDHETETEAAAAAASHAGFSHAAEVIAATASMRHGSQSINIARSLMREGSMERVLSDVYKSLLQPAEAARQGDAGASLVLSDDDDDGDDDGDDDDGESADDDGQQSGADSEPQASDGIELGETVVAGIGSGVSLHVSLEGEGEAEADEARDSFPTSPAPASRPLEAASHGVRSSKRRDSVVMLSRALHAAKVMGRLRAGRRDSDTSSTGSARFLSPRMRPGRRLSTDSVDSDLSSEDPLRDLIPEDERRRGEVTLPPLQFGRLADSLTPSFQARVKSTPQFHKAESRRDVWRRTVLKKQADRTWDVHKQHKSVRRR
ncbi:uncharacterized protein AMSG_04616 [Thecamonas trahens ATCC 50062]|uniref:EF-hand domain-containing protein n=1 Tax=Thecamonas trahens ATCC 50062 TaxID=461836 RepID=A0A0L0D9V3_THETB|nr:hypothetical protein AMSG_04616 [Thecamonas trahens ATCC 50062]KNC48871.1 hypothetical protein AMSG_04616 [Thecamonas trahens ATCC 50062]|eukprot:XP_013758291.1 hypothetical protein AMSG_04616 [Thecamonas trahens ATCC 50062]